MALGDGNHHLANTKRKNNRAALTSTRGMLQDAHGRHISANISDDIPIRRFRDAVNFPALLDVLETNEKYDAIIVELKKSTGKSRLPSLCRKHGVTLHELQMLYTDHMRHLGLLGAANNLPRIIEDVASDALNKLVLCGRCEGSGELITYEEDDEGEKVEVSRRACPTCEGVGRIVEMGDKHARELVFESMKLTGQKAPLVAIQQNIGGNGLDAAMEQTLKMTQGITLNPIERVSNESMDEDKPE